MNVKLSQKIIAFTLCAVSMSVFAYTDKLQQTGATMQTTAPLDGIQFLKQNKTKPGVITLPDGLQYKVITMGKGDKPTMHDIVTVDYVGTLVSGKEFDSSYKRGQPASFPVNGVIPGWTEALKLMPKGSTWELYIPSNLAYGEQGVPPLIGPNEVLIFKVNLIDIKKANPALSQYHSAYDEF